MGPGGGVCIQGCVRGLSRGVSVSRGPPGLRGRPPGGQKE